MATSSGQKQYTITINGVSQGITEVEKLEKAVDRLSSSVSSANNANQNSARTSTQRRQALTEEEKAEQQLAATIDRVVRARTDANRAQIEANLAARETQREVQREIQLRQVGETSIRGMGMRLTDLRNQYELLSAEQRNEIGVGDVLLQQIQALDAEYKALRESTGNFRDSVGNYERALSGLDRLGEGLEQVNSLGIGVNNTFGIGVGVMALFGANTEETAETQDKLRKVLALVTLATQVYNEVIRKNSAAGLANSVIERVRTIQTRARAAAEARATQGTVAATIAQRVYNAVANANPVLLLVAAILTLVGAYAVYTSTTDNATDSTNKYKSSIDGTTYSSKEARDAAERLKNELRDLAVQIDLVSGRISQFQAALTNISNAQSQALDELVDETQTKLDEVNSEYDNFFKKLGRSFINYAMGRDAVSFEQLEEERTQRVEAVFTDFQKRQMSQNDVYNKQREIEYTKQNEANIRLNEDYADRLLQGDAARIAQLNRQRDREVREARTRNEEINRINQNRVAENRIALVDITSIEKDYANQISDIQTAAARTAANERLKQLEERKRQTQENLAILRRFEDDQAGLIVNEFERRREVLRLTYDRQEEDLLRELETRTNLTAEGEEALRKMILNIAEHRRRDLAQVAEDELKDLQEKEDKRRAIIQQRAQDNEKAVRQEVQNLETYRALVTAIIGEIEARDAGGLQLIDVDKTRDNLARVKSLLNEYIQGIEAAYMREKEAHDYQLLNLEQGSAEYENEMNRHANVVLDLYSKMTEAQTELAETTQQESNLISTYLGDLTAKVSSAVDAVVQSMTAVLDTIGMALQYQIEGMQSELDTITERYEEAKQTREDSVNNIKQLEEELQAATGGTRDAIREQLQDEMQRRSEAQREEQRLQREKEKQEEAIRKKERQAKRVEMLTNIAMAIGNTASGATRAFSDFPFPFSAIVAAIITASGLAQVGIMTKQLTKLEDGGLINAPSHANGGARIQGTNIEVEGGEYVVNKRSTAANKTLIEYINRAEAPVNVADLIGLAPSGGGSFASIEDAETTEDRLLDAISNIEFKPVVSAVDIIDVVDQVTEVRELAGF